jgi:hypothetical protein
MRPLTGTGGRAHGGSAARALRATTSRTGHSKHTRLEKCLRRGEIGISSRLPHKIVASETAAA